MDNGKLNPMITYGMISPLAMVNVEFLTPGDINDLLDFHLAGLCIETEYSLLLKQCSYCRHACSQKEDISPNSFLQSDHVVIRNNTQCKRTGAWDRSLHRYE
jgi:hypothetical protein